MLQIMYADVLSSEHVFLWPDSAGFYNHGDRWCFMHILLFNLHWNGAMDSDEAISDISLLNSLHISKLLLTIYSITVKVCSGLNFFCFSYCGNLLTWQCFLRFLCSSVSTDFPFLSVVTFQRLVGVACSELTYLSSLFIECTEGISTWHA